MLPKPVTAFALSALVSLVSFTASSAAAATNTSPDSDVAASAAQVQATHHAKGKRATIKKKGHTASLHAAEPKASPKLAASLTTHLDLKTTSVKAEHGAVPKKTTIAATGKEIYIGGPTKPAATVKADKGDKPVVETSTTAVGKTPGKVAVVTARTGKGGPMAKAGRAPSRSIAKVDDSDSTSDDHPVPVALRGAEKPVAKPVAVCLHDPIEFVRGPESDSFSMTRCDGTAAPLAAERLSVLVRTPNAARPASIAELAKVEGQKLAPGVRRIDPGLVVRLQTLADHFAKPGMPQRVAIVSGYRPESAGSFHASAQALDFRLEGVPNEAVVDFCKTLENTGCGYYPNSSFVHVDVRAPGSGHVAWIDTSAPGEAPHYVSSWPPAPPADVKLAADDGGASSLHPQSLPPLPGDPRAKEETRTPAASMNAPLKLKEWE